VQPIYTANNLAGVAYCLRYTWSGWPSSGALPPDLPDDLQTQLADSWETDGLRRLEYKWAPETVQFTFSTKPSVAPVLLASRAKGRLQHALRLNGTPAAFSRKLSVRSIGQGTREQVEEYIQKQASKEPLADPRFREMLHSLAVNDDAVSLSQPIESESGRYWYCLHLVLVVQARYRFGRRCDLQKLRDGALAVARKKGYAISSLSVMPDHIHVSLRGDIHHSPEDIALSFLNNLAYVMGQNPVWEFGYYAGTFGEYRMDAVRG
jgi:REP element-mobilizing transposase RayT